jgi:hypothetical protein
VELELRQSLRADHFEQLACLLRGQLFEQVPLWLWSPLVSQAQCQRIARVARELGERLLELGLRERRLGREESWLPSREGLLESVRSDPWDTDPTFHWRFDFLWDRRTDRLQFLELNAGDPSGLGWVERFALAMRSHSLWENHLSAGRLRPFELAAGHRRALEAVLGPGPHPIVFAAAEQSTVGSDIACWAESFREAGYTVAVADPRAFEFDGQGVSVQGQRPRAVLRDTYEELYLPPYQGVGERLQARVLEGRLWLGNPLCASFWDSKTLWTALPECETVATTCRLRAIPESERHDWVLKPAFDYGGRGVLCGFACSGEEWRVRLESAWSQPEEWVLQRACLPPVEEFPFLGADGQLRWEPRYLTWSVFLNRLKFSGLLARAGQQPVVNVHNGGAIFPVYQMA